MQLLDAYWPAAWVTNETATAVAEAAPYWMIALELTIGLCMLCGQGRLGRVGTALGLLLYIGRGRKP